MNMRSLDEWSHTRLVDVVSEISGHGLFLVDGVASEQPPADALKERALRFAADEARTRLSRLNDEIDRLYDHLNAFRQRKFRARTDEECRDFEQEIVRCVQDLKAKQAEAAAEMRRQLEASGVRRRLEQGLAAIERAKELLDAREGSSKRDEAR